MTDETKTAEEAEVARLSQYEEPRVAIVLTHALTALADLEDEAAVRAHRWQAYRPTPGSGVWYARALIDGRYVFMHDLLMGPAVGMTVEHMNGDGLDNRRSNLFRTEAK